MIKSSALFPYYFIPEVISGKSLVNVIKNIEKKHPEVNLNYSGFIERQGDSVRFGSDILICGYMELFVFKITEDEARLSRPYQDLEKQHSFALLIGDTVSQALFNLHPGDWKLFAGTFTHFKNLPDPDDFGDILEIEFSYGVQ